MLKRIIYNREEVTRWLHWTQLTTCYAQLVRTLSSARRSGVMILIEELLGFPHRFAAYATTTDKRLVGIQGDLGVLKGISLETRLADKGLAQIASAFSMRRMRIVRLAEHNRASERFNEAVWAADG